MTAIRHLTSKLAQQIDEELMSASGSQFSLDQLMELAGLACAQTLATVYKNDKYPRVLVCCGPGNQGGDGLVAARHLRMFGYSPSVYMPKPGSKDIYMRLQHQCTVNDIPILNVQPDPIATLKSALDDTDVVLDAIFGFSFQPPIRSPFDAVLRLIKQSKKPVVSVDIPSGWDVEGGNIHDDAESGSKVGLEPDVLISLTAPKEGVRLFQGRHFLGGRFVPGALAERYQLNLPPYPGFDQIVELPRGGKL